MRIIKTIIQAIQRLLNSRWLWPACFAGAAVIHLGTAALRLDTFFPYPEAVDLASYYAGAWSLRLGLSPYLWSEGLLAFLAETQQLSVVPPEHHSPPLWAWLMQPLTLLPFPAASTAWLAILIVGAWCSHVMMMRIAGYTRWKAIALAFPITLTFGPLFLNLTIGQNGIVLLLAMLLLAKLLQKRGITYELLSAVIWIVAGAAKIFPVLWLACLLPLKRWRALACAVGLGTVALVLMFLAWPDISTSYVLEFLPRRLEYKTTMLDVNDQSILTYVRRIGASGSYIVHGLDARDHQVRSYTLPWELSAQTMVVISILVLLAIACLMIWAWSRYRPQSADIVLYVTVLFVMLAFPHMQRYNHVLAMPPMAWLWGAKHLPYRRLAVAAYGLFALSRLNHLWARLPAPIGPFATGFGLLGVLVLLFGLIHAMTRLDPSALGGLTGGDSALEAA